MAAFQNTPPLPIDVHFRKALAFDASIDIGSQPPPQLKELISSAPNLKIYTRSSPHFTNLKSIWNLQHTENNPLVLIRATSTEDVSTVIKFCVANNLPLTVRSGGHDLWGRSNVTDAVILDVRELNDIKLAEDKQSVTIGGGVQTGPLIDFLDSHGLVTSCTLAGIVGHVGWAFSGGFGPLVNAYGLGVDQIISAKIITADGTLQDADDELLWGIRGAGGAFGVITEAKFKIYSLPKMLGGMLMFQFDQAEDIVAGMQKLFESETVPAPLSVGFHFSKRGGNPVLSTAFSWASTDLEEGRAWLAKVKALGTVVMDMVSETTMKKWCDMMAPILPAPSYSTSRSIFIKNINPTTVKILTSAVEGIPDGVQFGIGTFLVSGEAIRPRPESSFRVREPYVFIHALGPVAEETRLEESRMFTDGVLNAMKEAGLIKANYLAIMAPDLSTEECFGKENFDRLKALKKKVDPGNVFKHVPASLT